METSEDNKAFVRAKNLVLRRLTRRDYSVKEIKQYLKKKGTEEFLIDEVVSFLLEKKILDDSRCAISIIRQQVRRAKGSLFIKHKLQQKGIRLSGDDFKSLLVAAGGIDELDMAQSIIKCKYPSARADRKVAARAFRALLRRGFSAEIARTVINKDIEE
ncbi:MAG: hypothetical protein A3K03_04900 [Bdellovibrionales bacterium RIFOXYD1_FULL_44_7]|nr:MAG: hypothetical protein A3K03_04900 [Bdellovibrionales bacterium RIFOXYD1_FULL_44_7]